MPPAGAAYGNGLGPQLSDDQFLQWGQAAQASNPYPDNSAYPMNANNYPANAPQPSTQLTRRPMNQIASRPPMNAAMNDAAWLEATNTSPGGGHADTAWGDDLTELEAKAQVAKREAQTKRKQIPPFVQKLNR